MMRETQCMTRETRASRIRFQTEPHEIPKSPFLLGECIGHGLLKQM